MKYEQFLESAARALSDSREVKEMISGMQAALSAVPDMVRKNERLEKENRELKGENVRLRAELDDWKGNAEGFQPDAYMKLPVDADGEPIRIGDVLYLPASPGSIVVSGYERSTCSDDVYCIGRQDGRKSHFCPKLWTHRQPEPPDSWEKLEEDAGMTTCMYAGQADSVDCSECKWKGPLLDCEVAMRREIIDRARRIADAEREAKRDGE